VLNVVFSRQVCLFEPIARTKVTLSPIPVSGSGAIRIASSIPGFPFRISDRSGVHVQLVSIQGADQPVQGINQPDEYVFSASPFEDLWSVLSRAFSICWLLSGRADVPCWLGSRRLLVQHPPSLSPSSKAIRCRLARAVLTGEGEADRLLVMSSSLLERRKPAQPLGPSGHTPFQYIRGRSDGP